MGQNPQVQQERPKQQEPVQAAAPDKLEPPAKLEQVVERKRLIELGKNIGKVEQSLERIEERLGSLVGEKLPASFEPKWQEMRAQVKRTLEDSEKAANQGSADFAQLDAKLKETNAALGVVEGLLSPSASRQSPQIGLPTGSVIAFDPMDASGAAALSSIIDLAKDPKKVDELLKTLKIDRPREGESLGKAIQRSLMKDIVRPPAPDADTGKPLEPTKNGDFIPKKK